MIKCNQDGCQNEAAYVFAWPGRVDAGICQVHVLRLRQVADAMGLSLQIIPLSEAESGQKQASP